jgi:hypothetical protein
MNHTFTSNLVDVDHSKHIGKSMWGWKSPRSLYYLPFYHLALKDKFRYVHVVRDGRDVSIGDNQMQHRGLCRHVNSVDDIGENLCGSSKDKLEDPSSRLEFWARMNTDAYNYGVRVLGPERKVLPCGCVQVLVLMFVQRLEQSQIISGV